MVFKGWYLRDWTDEQNVIVGLLPIIGPYNST